MPTPFVGLHLALVVLITLLGLTFILTPCGGDLCLGGVVGLLTLGVAAFGGVGLVVWRVARRASPLLVLDSLLVGVAGPIALDLSAGVQAFYAVLVLLVLLAGLPAAALAGREVAGHLVESTLAVAMLVFLAFVGREGGKGLVVGLVALTVGWAWTRTAARRGATGQPPAAPGAPPASD